LITVGPQPAKSSANIASAVAVSAYVAIPGKFELMRSLIPNDGMQKKPPMSSITICNLDPALKERLRIGAARHGHSMEAKARNILQSALKEPERLPARNLYQRIRARIEPLGGADDLELPPRLPDRDPPRFD
jgi:plasmid stability protein